MDNEVGRLLSALELYGFANNTIIALLSDHGKTHYANMPIQYTAIFKGCKNDNFH